LTTTAVICQRISCTDAMNNIKLVYLPHSSHTLQLLDISIFSLTKRRYRKVIGEIARYDDTGPVKKARFIEFYDCVRKYALSARNIQSSWRGAGLVPHNPAKVLASKQVQLGEVQAPKTPMTSRKRALSDDLSYLCTPTNEKELQETINRLKMGEQLSRSLHTAFGKMCEAWRPTTSCICLCQMIN